MFLYACIKNVKKEGKEKVYEVRGMNFKTEEKPENQHRKTAIHETWIDYTENPLEAVNWIKNCILEQ